MKSAHLAAFGGCFVAAARKRRCSCRPDGGGSNIRRCQREVGAVVVGGVVVDHIHHHAYARTVQSLHHFFHFVCGRQDLPGRWSRNPRVRCSSSRVIAPSYTGWRQIGFVDGVIVVGREYVYVGHPSSFRCSMPVLSPASGDVCSSVESKEFSLCCDARRRMHAEIAVGHFVDDGIR